MARETEVKLILALEAKGHKKALDTAARGVGKSIGEVGKLAQETRKNVEQTGKLATRAFRDVRVEVRKGAKGVENLEDAFRVAQRQAARMLHEYSVGIQKATKTASGHEETLEKIQDRVKAIRSEVKGVEFDFKFGETVRDPKTKQFKSINQREGDILQVADQFEKDGLFTKMDVFLSRMLIRVGIAATVIRSLEEAFRLLGSAMESVVQSEKVSDVFQSYILLSKDATAGMQQLGRTFQTLGGTVDTFTAIQTTMRARMAGLSEETIPKIALAARVLSRAIGVDTVEAFDRLGRGIAKQEVEILDELGLIVRLNDSLRLWAQQNDRTVASMSAQERQIAFTNEVLGVLAEKYGQVTTLAGRTTERIEQMKAQWKDLGIFFGDAFREIGLGLASAGQGVLQFTADMLGMQNSVSPVVLMMQLAQTSIRDFGEELGSVFGRTSAMTIEEFVAEIERMRRVVEDADEGTGEYENAVQDLNRVLGILVLKYPELNGFLRSHNLLIEKNVELLGEALEKTQRWNALLNKQSILSQIDVFSGMTISLQLMNAELKTAEDRLLEMMKSGSGEGLKEQQQTIEALRVEIENLHKARGAAAPLAGVSDELSQELGVLLGRFQILEIMRAAEARAVQVAGVSGAGPFGEGAAQQGVRSTFLEDAIRALVAGEDDAVRAQVEQAMSRIRERAPVRAATLGEARLEALRRTPIDAGIGAVAGTPAADFVELKKRLSEQLKETETTMKELQSSERELQETQARLLEARLQAISKEETVFNRLEQEAKEREAKRQQVEVLARNRIESERRLAGLLSEVNATAAELGTRNIDTEAKRKLESLRLSVPKEFAGGESALAGIGTRRQQERVRELGEAWKELTDDLKNEVDDLQDEQTRSLRVIANNLRNSENEGMDAIRALMEAERALLKLRTESAAAIAGFRTGAQARIMPFGPTGEDLGDVMSDIAGGLSGIKVQDALDAVRGRIPKELIRRGERVRKVLEDTGTLSTAATDMGEDFARLFVLSLERSVGSIQALPGFKRGVESMVTGFENRIAAAFRGLGRQRGLLEQIVVPEGTEGDELRTQVMLASSNLDILHDSLVDLKGAARAAREEGLERLGDEAERLSDTLARKLSLQTDKLRVTLAAMGRAPGLREQFERAGQGGQHILAAEGILFPELRKGTDVATTIARLEEASRNVEAQKTKTAESIAGGGDPSGKLTAELAAQELQHAILVGRLETLRAHADSFRQMLAQQERGVLVELLLGGSTTADLETLIENANKLRSMLRDAKDEESVSFLSALLGSAEGLVQDKKDLQALNREIEKTRAAVGAVSAVVGAAGKVVPGVSQVGALVTGVVGLRAARKGRDAQILAAGDDLAKVEQIESLGVLADIAAGAGLVGTGISLAATAWNFFNAGAEEARQRMEEIRQEAEEMGDAISSAIATGFEDGSQSMREFLNEMLFQQVAGELAKNALQASGFQDRLDTIATNRRTLEDERAAVDKLQKQVAEDRANPLPEFDPAVGAIKEARMAARRAARARRVERLTAAEEAFDVANEAFLQSIRDSREGFGDLDASVGAMSGVMDEFREVFGIARDTMADSLPTATFRAITEPQANILMSLTLEMRNIQSQIEANTRITAQVLSGEVAPALIAQTMNANLQNQPAQLEREMGDIKVAQEQVLADAGFNP